VTFGIPDEHVHLGVAQVFAVLLIHLAAALEAILMVFSAEACSDSSNTSPSPSFSAAAMPDSVLVKVMLKLARSMVMRMMPLYSQAIIHGGLHEESPVHEAYD